MLARHRPDPSCGTKLATRVGLLLCVAVSLGACQAPYTRIERHVEVRVAPDVYCLLEKLRDAATAGAITYTTERLPVGTRHSYVFMIAKDYFSWFMVAKPDGTWAITTSTGVDDSRPHDLPAVRRRLLEIEGTVRNQCGLGTALDQATENCHGKACAAA